MELFCRYILESWKRIIANVIANHRWNYSISIFQRVNFFSTHCPSIKPSLIFFINDGFTDKPEITDEIFSDDRFLPVNPSIK